MLEHELNVEGVFASEKTMRDEWGWTENLAYVRPDPSSFNFNLFLNTPLPPKDI